MSDNKLRCILVYRLQRTKTATADSSSSGGGVDGIALTNLSPGPVTLLAKYDHASEYESHEGSAAGGLYGDREKNYADAVAMVISGDPPRGITEENTIGGFKIVQSDMHQVIYGADSRGLCELFALSRSRSLDCLPYLIAMIIFKFCLHIFLGVSFSTPVYTTRVQLNVNFDFLLIVHTKPGN